MVEVRNLITDQTSFTGLAPAARAMFDAIVRAAGSIGITRLDIIAGAGAGHQSHGQGTEIDLIAYNADGSTWTPAQRVRLAEAAASAGGNRFGFYTRADRPVSILHVGLGYPGAAQNVAWGPNGQTSGVGLSSFYPEEQSFVQSLRNGQISSYTGSSVEAAAPAAPSTVIAMPELQRFIAAGGILRRGDNGAKVEELQRFLNDGGYRDADGRELAVDGDFGQRTVQALRAFQEARGITVDGRLGPQSFSRMAGTQVVGQAPNIPTIANLAQAAESGEIVGVGSEGDNVRELQQFLNNQGVTDGRGQPLVVDGKFGGRTREAVRTYQAAQGILVDGRIGPQTLEYVRRDLLQAQPTRSGALDVARVTGTNLAWAGRQPPNLYMVPQTTVPEAAAAAGPDYAQRAIQTMLSRQTFVESAMAGIGPAITEAVGSMANHLRWPAPVNVVPEDLSTLSARELARLLGQGAARELPEQQYQALQAEFDRRRTQVETTYYYADQYPADIQAANRRIGVDLRIAPPAPPVDRSFGVPEPWGEELYPGSPTGPAYQAPGAVTILDPTRYVAETEPPPTETLTFTRLGLPAPTIEQRRTAALTRLRPNLEQRRTVAMSRLKPQPKTVSPGNPRLQTPTSTSLVRKPIVINPIVINNSSVLRQPVPSLTGTPLLKPIM